ncbi:MAG: COG4315 family predicted lipoprotein [Solirubrobacterales bacterium]
MRLSARSAAALALAALSVAAAGCGSDNKTSTENTAAKSGATQSTAASAMKTAEITTKNNDKLGEILAGAKNHTVYMFEADKGGKSACTADCAAAWPPVTADGSATAGGSAKDSMLGTITREDGSKQVTYNSHPLYYYVKDTDEEDAYGNDVSAFGADWYAMTAAGAKAEAGKSGKDSSKSSTSEGDSSSGYGGY